MFKKKPWTAIYVTENRKYGHVEGETPDEARDNLSQLLQWGSDKEVYAAVLPTEDLEKKARESGSDLFPNYTSAIRFYLKEKEKNLKPVREAKAKRIEDF